MAKKRRKKRKHRFFWFVIRLQVFLMLLVVGGMGYYFYGGYAKEVQELKDEAYQLVAETNESTFIPARASSLYDKDNNLISELKSEKDAKYVKYQDIPSYFTTAMVSVEDKKFYRHNGIDYPAMIRAAKAIIQDGRISQGGSTITMQLARNIYLDTGKNWQRKLKEMFIAQQLEKRYSKNQIMEFYLNNIYFSNGYYGVDAACHGYFDCELTELDLSQIAFLCAIPNSPTYYDPLVNIEHTLERRNKILRNMYEDGRISEEVCKAAMEETIELKLPQAKERKKNNSVDTYAYYCATRALMENGGFNFRDSFESEEDEKAYDEEYDSLYTYYQKQLYTQGYKIYTSIDIDKQTALQESIDTVLADFDGLSEEGVYEMQGAAVSIDNETGMVVAIVGSRSQEFSGYTLNRAYQSHRQPGSSIKPLIVYTPSFERGYNPKSIVNDHEFEGGPSNAGDVYYGEVEISFAVAKSLNTVAWQLYEELTPEVGLRYLKNMNFSHIVNSDYVTATALGGFTTGVSSLEMASAYATIENDGIYRLPTCIMTIVDATEKVIYSNTPVEKIIYTETASRMMVSCMEGVMADGTGKNLKLDGMPCAGKTGTTNDQKDGWFCGFTRYYTTCVWVGYDIPKTVDDLKGASYPGYIWNSYMSRIHDGLTPMAFLPYAQLSSDFLDSETQEESESEEAQEEQEDVIPDDGSDNGGMNPDNQQGGQTGGQSDDQSGNQSGGQDNSGNSSADGNNGEQEPGQNNDADDNNVDGDNADGNNADGNNADGNNVDGNNAG